MILRLIIAFTRWAWGVSPAFVTANSEVWYTVMYFGMIIDIAVIAILTTALIGWIKYRSEK
jgi:hypothetical protein